MKSASFFRIPDDVQYNLNAFGNSGIFCSIPELIGFVLQVRCNLFFPGIIVSRNAVQIDLCKGVRDSIKVQGDF